MGWCCRAAWWALDLQGGRRCFGNREGVGEGAACRGPATSGMLLRASMCAEM